MTDMSTREAYNFRGREYLLFKLTRMIERASIDSELKISAGRSLNIYEDEDENYIEVNEPALCIVLGKEPVLNVVSLQYAEGENEPSDFHVFDVSSGGRNYIRCFSEWHPRKKTQDLKLLAAYVISKCAEIKAIGTLKDFEV